MTDPKTDFQIRAIAGPGDLDGIRALWEELQWHPTADFDLFKTVVQLRQNVISPLVLVLSRNEEPVALLAGRIEDEKIPIRFGYARLGGLSVRQFVVIAGGFMGERSEGNWLLLMKYLDGLLLERLFDLVYFECLEIGSVETEQEIIKHVFKPKRFLINSQGSPHWLLRLPRTWDEFLKNRSSKHRYWLKRLSKVLDREFDGDWGIQAYSNSKEARAFFEAAESVAATTYQRGLQVGFVGNEETWRRIEADALKGRLRGYVLYIRHESRAFWYCFCFRNSLYMVATGYNPAFRSYELGTVLLMKLLQDHCGAGIEIVDFGLGDAGYKRRFGSECYEDRSAYLSGGSCRGLCLRGTLAVMNGINGFARNLLDRFLLTQWVKTGWRRIVASRTVGKN